MSYDLGVRADVSVATAGQPTGGTHSPLLLLGPPPGMQGTLRTAQGEEKVILKRVRARVQVRADGPWPCPPPPACHGGAPGNLPRRPIPLLCTLPTPILPLPALPAMHPHLLILPLCLSDLQGAAEMAEMEHVSPALADCLPRPAAAAVAGGGEAGVWPARAAVGLGLGLRAAAASPAALGAAPTMRCCCCCMPLLWGPRARPWFLLCQPPPCSARTS